MRCGSRYQSSVVVVELGGLRVETHLESLEAASAVRPPPLDTARRVGRRSRDHLRIPAGSISNNIDGGALVLYAVASALIGGTSLSGGRAKMVHAVLGAVVIAAIVNGMGLIGLDAATQYMITALVPARRRDGRRRRSPRAHGLIPAAAAGRSEPP